MSVTSVTLGVAAGIVFAWLWLWVVPWAVHGRFFRVMGGVTREIFGVDDPQRFFSLYKILLGDTARYVGRNLAGMVVAGLPVALLVLLVDVQETPFLVAFVASMMVVFCWPRLWPAPRAS